MDRQTDKREVISMMLRQSAYEGNTTRHVHRDTNKEIMKMDMVWSYIEIDADGQTPSA